MTGETESCHRILLEPQTLTLQPKHIHYTASAPKKLSINFDYPFYYE